MTTLLILPFIVVELFILAKPCPKIPSVDNFDMDKFAKGTWKELYQNIDDPFRLPGGSKCVEKQPRYDKLSETLTVDTYAISESNNMPHRYIHHGFGSVGSGSFVFPVQNTTFDQVSFTIVDIEYESYLLSYICANDDHKRYLSIGLYGRENHHFLRSKLDDVTKMFDFYGLKVNFVPTDWQDCRAVCSH